MGQVLLTKRKKDGYHWVIIIIFLKFGTWAILTRILLPLSHAVVFVPSHDFNATEVDVAAKTTIWITTVVQ